MIEKYLWRRSHHRRVAKERSRLIDRAVTNLRALGNGGQREDSGLRPHGLPAAEGTLGKEIVRWSSQWLPSDDVASLSTVSSISKMGFVRVRRAALAMTTLPKTAEVRKKRHWVSPTSACTPFPSAHITGRVPRVAASFIFHYTN